MRYVLVESLCNLIARLSIMASRPSRHSPGVCFFTSANWVRTPNVYHHNTIPLPRATEARYPFIFNPRRKRSSDFRKNVVYAAPVRPKVKVIRVIRDSPPGFRFKWVYVDPCIHQFIVLRPLVCFGDSMYAVRQGTYYLRAIEGHQHGKAEELRIVPISSAVGV